ncbi:MAG TPA: DnaJ C-terminal domain-containing protein [Acidobacteriota bacterium]|jgi:DnaJ-class molecular chaperone|nr:hypothetical protein [Acidobacteriota bacterium]MDP6081342.1 DnaJ C-terminal domain-containing protein [Arenicellales bacterium]HJO29166.1 DnaJ C-terminal domain-containing protein [Acidobacteriota bacterium]|tara:strand:- start:1776 stop:2735 length:960 start_codon:yes stop_codon:yes gene_type:complete
MPAAGQKDYYRILGVSKDAPLTEIKKAYRKQARQHHPDVNPGDSESEERFKEVAEAYHVLGDKQRRAAYDRGPERFAQEFDLSDFFNQFHHGPSGGRAGMHFESGGFGNLFDMFGGAGATRGQGYPNGIAQAGRDLEINVQLGFEEALKGVERTVQYGVHQGTGAKDAISTKVRIPAGIEDGKRIRVKGRGEPGIGGGPPGNLYLRIQVASHPLFTRKGADLYLELPVTVYEAGLGATVPVPTLDGPMSIKLPPGTRSGQVIRLSGKGAKRPGPDNQNSQGNLFVSIRIELPGELDQGSKALLEQFESDHPYNPRRNME